MIRYVFVVGNSHPVLLAGLPAHPHETVWSPSERPEAWPCCGGVSAPPPTRERALGEQGEDAFDATVEGSEKGGDGS